MATKSKPKPTRNYTVFRRSDTGRFGVRFSLPGHGQIRMALDALDEEEAEQQAAEKYLEAKIRAEHGLLRGTISFEKLAADYLKWLYAEAKRQPSKLARAQYAQAAIERYLSPYFKQSPITAIYHHHLMEYLDWRRVYWTEGPGKDEHWIEYRRGDRRLQAPAKHTEASENTLKRESSVLRGVFKHAVRRGYMKQGDVPKLELPRSAPQKRPSFTQQQYNNLLEVSAQRIAEVSTNPRLGFERYMLNNFIIIAAETGMRPTELFNLDWGHVEGIEEAMSKPIKDQSITVIAFGKGRKPQRFVPKRGSIRGFEGAWKAFRKQFGRDPEAKDPVFCNQHGERMGSYRKSLNALLEAANLRKDAFGNFYSAYSFRHSYATWALQKSPPVDIYTLAINMRTSVEMIEKWYSDVIPEDQAAMLRGDDEW